MNASVHAYWTKGFQDNIRMYLCIIKAEYKYFVKDNMPLAFRSYWSLIYSPNKVTHNFD